ncbi:Single-stranded DNA binding protein [Methanococcoides methylutens]|uniref:Replication protein A (Two OB fold, one zinc finger) n=1 Tax=Methanococcoides methylutens MM1 TaxID=1434104 RepID=A0A0E3ST52_METMT|nr:Single-stranded DNA binding protein [Methanococcoides methylutens]AKB85918.1 Replication protein A (two OB fold, one zinc finger) [Methanococcoides methylutens MM1]
MDEKFAPHIEELTRALGHVSRSIIEEELELLLKYRVPIDEAKRSVLKKFRDGSPVTKKVNDLVIGDKGIALEVRILEINEKDVNLRGEAATIFSGVLGDETGMCSFTSWKPISLNSGDAVKILNASVRSWRNRAEVNIGDRSEVELLQDTDLPDISELSETPVKKLSEIGYSDMFVSSVAAVIELYHREVDVKGRNLTIIEGVLADETGRLPFVSWSLLDGVDIGSILRFEDASVSMYRGVPSIHLNESTPVRIVGPDGGLSFTFDSVNVPPEPLPIKEVLQNEGMFDVSVKGNIVSVRPGSGLITRCPECNRVIMKNSCRSHGVVEGIQDMRIKLILDDGTGSLLVMLNRELSEIVYGKTLQECELVMGKSMSANVVYDDMKNILTGRYLGVRGNTSRVEYGVTFVAKSVWAPSDDPEKRISALLERLEGVEA